MHKVNGPVDTINIYFNYFHLGYLLFLCIFSPCIMKARRVAGRMDTNIDRDFLNIEI